jgi:hypothetical protein
MLNTANVTLRDTVVVARRRSEDTGAASLIQ